MFCKLLSLIFFASILLFNPTSVLANNCVNQCDENYKYCSSLYDYGSDWYQKEREICYKLEGKEREDCLWNLVQTKVSADENCDGNYDLCKMSCSSGQGSGGSGSGSRMLEDKPCPPGTEPSPLGVCQAIFKATEETPDIYPNDGCSPGTVRGTAGECRPLFFVTFVAQFREGRFVICPPGTKVGPLGVCTLDKDQLGEPSASDEDQNRHCPPGMSPGPRGGCIPTETLNGQGNIFGLEQLKLLANDVMIKSEENFKNIEVFKSYGVIPADDVERSLSIMAESLRAEPWQRQ